MILGGSVYMPNARVYIHDAGRLTFEIGKRRDADGYAARIGEMTVSRLVAKQVIFTGNDPRVFIQFAHYLTASEIEKFRDQLVQPELKKLEEKLEEFLEEQGGSSEPPLSEIFVVDDVIFLQNINHLTLRSALKVSSSDVGQIGDAGVIVLKANAEAGLHKGRFSLT